MPNIVGIHSKKEMNVVYSTVDCSFHELKDIPHCTMVFSKVCHC
jgi:hypothetical protein